MVKLNRQIIRVLVITFYILIIALIISGLSALFAYLNTGADRSTILHTEIKKIDQYLPKVMWSELNNEGRPMDDVTLKKIEHDYLDAWYVKHIANKTNLKNGIEDFYTDNARENLYKFIDLNLSKNITIESTTLEHHPTLEFFSEDGQLAVITDKNVIEYKRIFKDESLQLETTEISTYKIILLLEDGFWRIRHFIKEKTEDYVPEINQIPTEKLDIKGINYYPQDTPWNMFGDVFSEDIIEKDFRLIKDAGLNTVRLFIPYETFGKAAVFNDKLDRLKQTLVLAEKQNIKVVLTLFDFYGDYRVLDWTLNMRHAETIVSELKKYNSLLAWDIKNEPNLDFDSRGETQVIAWLNTMVTFIKSIDDSHPVTIGWSNSKSATLLKDKVDFVSFHYYDNLNDLNSALKSLKEKIKSKPIVLGEFGMSSYNGFWKPFGNSEKDQADYHKKAQEIIAENNLQFMSWTLYDFKEIPKEVVGRLPWRKNIQKRFGFINQSGAKKEAFEFITLK